MVSPKDNTITIFQNQFVSIHNCFACCLFKMKKLDASLFYKESSIESIIPPESLELHTNKFKSELSEFAAHNDLTVSAMLSQYGIPQKIYDSFKIFDKSFIDLYNLVLFLDSELDDDYYSFLPLSPKSFKSLNENSDETGIFILPRMKAIYDQNDELYEKDSKQCHSGKLHWIENRRTLVFSHFYFIESDALITASGITFNIENHVINPSTLYKAANENFKIALCPVLCQKTDSIFNINYDETKGPLKAIHKKFSISGLKQPERIRELLRNAIQLSSDEKADMIVFPELLGDECSESEAFWRSIIDDIEEAGGQSPAIITAPTWWHDNRNEGFVFDNVGNRLFCFQKQFPFTNENGYIENLKDSDRCIHILHINGIGRIVFAICRDYLTASYKNIIMQNTGATFIIIPSYSPGKAQFEHDLFETIQHGCYGIWLNSCSARYSKQDDLSIPPKNCGIVFNPIYSSESNDEKIALSPECLFECNTAENKTCIFIVTVSPYNDPTIDIKFCTSSDSAI